MKKPLNTWFIHRLYIYGKIDKYDLIREEGKYFEYPKCCIENYIKLVKSGNLVGVESIKGTCFVPCPVCSEKGIIKAKHFTAVKKDDEWDVKFDCYKSTTWIVR